MGVPKNHIGFKGDECQCGRRASLLHCTKCGSSRLYARRNRLHKLPDGTAKLVEIERVCQTCGHCFIDVEREFCEAPPVGEVLLRIKASLKASQLASELPQQTLDELLAPISPPNANSNLSPTASSTPNEAPSEASEAIAQTPEELMRSWRYTLKCEYADKVVAGFQHTETMNEYVERRLKEILGSSFTSAQVQEQENQSKETTSDAFSFTDETPNASEPSSNE